MSLSFDSSSLTKDGVSFLSFAVHKCRGALDGYTSVVPIGLPFFFLFFFSLYTYVMAAPLVQLSIEVLQCATFGQTIKNEVKREN